MSGGGGTTSSNSTTTVPPQVLAEYQQVTGQANQVASAPLNQYEGQVVAGTTPTEQSAYNTINNMQGITAPYTQQASNLLGQASQTINPQTVGASQIQQYESPYTQNVLGSTMAAENNQDAQQQAQLQGNAISSGAWGGDRAGVAQGILGGQQAIANNATNAGILNQGYSQALQEANTQQQAGLGAQEASQYLQESAGLGMNQLGTSAQSNALAGASAQLNAGQLQQQQAQAELNVPYEQFLQQQAYPFQTTGWLGNIAEGIGSNTGSSTTGSSTAPSQGLFSDRRLKKNIDNAGILVGKRGHYPLHTFEYKGSDQRHTGVIAQEVEKKNPDAVHMDPSGYRKVDYTKLARGGIVPHRADGGSTSTYYSMGVPLSQEAADAAIAQGAILDTTNPNAAFYQSNSTTSTPASSATPSGSGTFTAQVAPTYAQFAASPAAQSGTPYTGGIVAGLNAANQADLKAIYGKSRGGIVAHRDSGGSTPDDSAIASNSILRHIQQIPQRLRFQQAAQGSAYGTGDQQAILTGGMKRGGIVPHFDEGGSTLDGDYDPTNYAMAPGSATGIQNAARDGYNSIPADDNGMGALLQQAGTNEPASQSSIMPAPTPPVSALDHPDNMPSTSAPNYETEMPKTHEANPWLSVAAGVLGTLAGRSRNPLVDIGQGGLIGLNNYAEQQNVADKQNYEEGSFHQNAQKLMQEAQMETDKFKEEKLRDANMADYQKGELGIRQQELQKPIFDKYGNPWQMNPQTKTYQRVDMSPASMSSPAGAGATNNNPRDAAIDILQQEGVPVLPVAPNDPGALKAQQAYQAAGQVAQSMLDTLNHQKALIGTYTSGPRGDANKGWLPSAAGMKYGSEELAAGNADDLAARQEAEKDANTLAMQQTSLLKNARPGLRMIQFAGTTVPNPNMSDKAQLSLINENTDKLNQQVQRGQIASMYSGLHPKNIDAIMNNYETANPTTLSDGSRNSNWMPYRKWIASGRPDTAQLPANSGASVAAPSVDPAALAEARHRGLIQ